MKKFSKLILAFFTLIPFFYNIFFIGLFMSLVIGYFRPEESGIDLFRIILPLHLGCLLLIICLMVIYMINAYKNPTIPKDKRSIWFILLFFGSILVMPVYWYIFIWKTEVTVLGKLEESL